MENASTLINDKVLSKFTSPCKKGKNEEMDYWKCLYFMTTIRNCQRNYDFKELDMLSRVK